MPDYGTTNLTRFLFMILLRIFLRSCLNLDRSCLIMEPLILQDSYLRSYWILIKILRQIFSLGLYRVLLALPRGGTSKASLLQPHVHHEPGGTLRMQRGAKNNLRGAQLCPCKCHTPQREWREYACVTNKEHAYIIIIISKHSGIIQAHTAA